MPDGLDIEKLARLIREMIGRGERNRARLLLEKVVKEHAA